MRLPDGHLIRIPQGAADTTTGRRAPLYLFRVWEAPNGSEKVKHKWRPYLEKVSHKNSVCVQIEPNNLHVWMGQLNPHIWIFVRFGRMVVILLLKTFRSFVYRMENSKVHHMSIRKSSNAPFFKSRYHTFTKKNLQN